MELEQYRKEIDQLDNQLLEILNRRMEVVQKVGELKRVTKTSIYRPEREKSIIDRLSKLNKGPLKKGAIEAIYQEIFAISRNLELPELVSYLGPESSFTHQAAESRFGAMSDYLALDTIKSVFESVSTGRAKFGVVPLENNQEGIVTETIDLLSSFELNIVAEVPLSIHFALGTIQERVHEIQKIYSRDIAFRQCRKFLNETFIGRNVELIPVDSTSKAVKLARNEPGAAAICSHIAAAKYNLPILFNNIEDSEDNFTRFLIVAKDMVNQPGGHDKTTILAKTSDKPGSLVSFLQDFQDAGINLTKIESRPAKKGKTFKYWFYIDFEGHFADEKVAPVIEKHKKEIKLLGSYVRLC